eukprot:1161424-Pelagomonas_calceolata.AAC.8
MHIEQHAMRPFNTCTQIPRHMRTPNGKHTQTRPSKHLGRHAWLKQPKTLHPAKGHTHSPPGGIACSLHAVPCSCQLALHVLEVE